MKHDDLPARWAIKLKSYISEELKNDRGRLSASDFPYLIKIDFEDGSFAFFRYAFYLLDHDLKEMAIFTEHCGYHIFPLVGTKIELLEAKWTETDYENDE